MNNELQHHGILGMKWGVRRYQNEDGSLTTAGEKRYGDRGQRDSKRSANKTSKLTDQDIDKLRNKGYELMDQADKEYANTETGKYEKHWRKQNPDADMDDLGDDETYNMLYDREQAKLNEIDHMRDDARVLISAQKYTSERAKSDALATAVLSAPIIGIVTAKNIKAGRSALGPLLVGGALVGISAAQSLVSAPAKLQRVRDKYGV